MTDTHPCDACGGSGIGAGLRCPCHGVASTCCPVCLGEGRFPDRMPARDAVADAETLRLCGLIEAGIFGIGTAAAMIRQPHAGIWDGLELLDAPQLLVAAQARLNARAAFRAVPGLRG